MKLILCDNKKIKIKKNKDDIIIYPDDNLKPCIGCFTCWIKTPTKCIYKDNGNIQELLAKADELIIISKNNYGSFNTKIKRILDRSISYVLPYFRKKDKLSRHKKRYTKELNVSAYIYGINDVNDEDTMNNILKSTSENLGGKLNNIVFLEKESDLKL